jgi:hypothetical protein
MITPAIANNIIKFEPSFFDNVCICAPYIPAKSIPGVPIGYFVNEHLLSGNVTSNVIFINNPYETTLSKLEEFISLNKNWDGYGAMAVTIKAGDNAKKFLTCLNDIQIENIFDVFPNPHGTITFEWENKLGEKLSLDIGENNYSYFITYLNKNPKLFDGKDIFSSIREITSEINNMVRE